MHTMQPNVTDVARSVVSVSVCVLGTRVSCANTAEPIEMTFGGLTHVDPRNHVLAGGQDRTNPLADPRNDETAMRSFARLLWTIV